VEKSAKMGHTKLPISHHNNWSRSEIVKETNQRKEEEEEEEDPFKILIYPRH
jgi:hypothetical protein